MRRWARVAAGAAALAAVLAVGTAKANGVPTVTQTGRGHTAMSVAEIQQLVPAKDFNRSVEGRAYLQKTAGSSVAGEHCYGVVYWKYGADALGITQWKIWNHTAWCGVPYDRVIDGTTHGYTDTYTCCGWSASSAGWRAWFVARNQRNTDGHAYFKLSLQGYDVQAYTVHTCVAVFADGGSRWGAC